MVMKNLCKIDKLPCVTKIVKTRARKQLRLFYCKKCDFEFFSHNPEKNLKLNKLDVSRLKKAGIKVPSVKEDFKNGMAQSKNYLKKYINRGDKKNNILEVGSSWGYFLSLLKDFGSISSDSLNIQNVSFLSLFTFSLPLLLLLGWVLLIL